MCYFLFSDFGVWQSCCSVGKWEFTIQGHVTGIWTPKQMKDTQSQLGFTRWLKWRVAHMHKPTVAYLQMLIVVASTDFANQRHGSHFKGQTKPNDPDKLSFAAMSWKWFLKKPKKDYKTVVIALYIWCRHTEANRISKCDKTSTSLGKKFKMIVLYKYILCLNLQFSGHIMEWSHYCK